jgi:hypothetical protein
MRRVPGATFWVGSDPEERFSDDESPRYRTRISTFCLDETEVTVDAYAKCVNDKACSAPHREQPNCNSHRKGRGEHPVNCVTWEQAEKYCALQKARLPTEAEWEFAARGGDEYRKYPWGNESPDDRACWKHAGTCKVRSFPAGAFGLYDMSGNVWEWTEDWYGPYPWPPATAFAKVYRGGSFSRRFEKWMHTRLRNRQNPRDSGSHLGFRCAVTPEHTSCAFGKSPNGRCLHGVLERRCEQGTSWNGVRCAAAGEPRCREGRVEKPGHGCVRELEDTPQNVDLAELAKDVRRERSSEFDADCSQNSRDRPHSFRYVGGTHDARNFVSRRAGCKNRDVGVGWNSTCCP